MNDSIQTAVTLIRDYCSKGDCVGCVIRDRIGCDPASGEVYVPCNWEDEKSAPVE